MAAFPNARFHLQAAEMAYATGPCMCHDHLRYPFTADHVCEMVRNVYSGRVMFHDGDGEVAPGVTVHKIGGHSRGLQCVRVMTATRPGRARLRQLALLREFREGQGLPDHHRHRRRARRLRRGSRRWPPRRGMSCPGHDPLVLQRYPALNSQTQGIVHRLDVARLDG